MITYHSSSSIPMTNKTCEKASWKYQTRKSPNGQRSFFWWANSKLWESITMVFTQTATFSLSSARSITYSQLWSQARCLIEPPTKVLWLHLSRHFQTLYACAKTVTWQLSSEVAGQTVRVLCWTLCERFDFCELWTVEHCIMNNYGNSYGSSTSSGDCLQCWTRDRHDGCLSVTLYQHLGAKKWQTGIKSNG